MGILAWVISLIAPHLGDTTNEVGVIRATDQKSAATLDAPGCNAGAGERGSPDRYAVEIGNDVTAIPADGVVSPFIRRWSFVAGKIGLRAPIPNIAQELIATRV